jgi:phosphoribosylanthranilate isomerase
MTWIKICGITNLEDALAAVDAGADALGFVFYEKSPRKIGVEAARDIVKKLPSSIEKVGVFAGDSVGCWPDIAGSCDLTAVQIPLCGYAPPRSDGELAAVSPSRPRRVYLALPAAWLIEGQFRLDLREPFDTIFLDSSTTQHPGGTGQVFDWAKAAPLLEKMCKGINVVVAGGLDPDNVATAMRILKPWGVDVTSGVEAKPGTKDSEKVRAFIAAVRREDKRS